MTRREFSRKQRFEIIKRASNHKGQITCEGCGLVLGPKAWEIDHTIAEALVIDKSKPLTIEEGRLLGMCCHRGPDGKTASDVTAIAKAKRLERRQMGIKKPSRFQCARSGRFKQKLDGRVELRNPDMEGRT
jgi:hypothetical protein